MPSGKERSYTLKQTCSLQLLDAGLFKFVWSFVPPGTKELRELNICDTKNCEIKVCELDLEKGKNCRKIAN